MNRTVFLIDGFNLYHSLKYVSRHLRGASTKWLDVYSLCISYLHMIGNNAQIVNVYYFSALATHLQKTDPGKITRHRKLIECLEASGVTVKLANFKKAPVWCKRCRAYINRYEEKEADVAISAKLLEICVVDECDTIAIVSGDKDLAPAVRTARRLYPNKTLCFVFPYRRKNKELAQLVHHSFNIHPKKYLQHQFPDPVVLPNGQQIHKPIEW